MDSIKNAFKITKKAVQPKPSKYLHSPAHLLADELCLRFNDKRHFGFYLKLAVTYDHAFLRKLCGEVMENKNVKTPGKLFAYLIKKHNETLKKSAAQ
ncbi:MAG: hypothetical protein JNN11_03980 [Candidatus Doudnabacteria bacterium]|nr:hypothetical protein [Candidatus Doudnabacteria bacterium]